MLSFLDLALTRAFTVARLLGPDVLGELEEDDREVVRLALHGQSVAEISDRIGRTQRTVYRVLDRIRRMLSPNGAHA